MPSLELGDLQKTPSGTHSIGLRKQLAELSSRSATRKIFDLMSEADKAESAQDRPDASAFREAILSLLRSKKPNLAFELHMLRTQARQSRPNELPQDVPLILSLLRATLRDEVKRKDRPAIFERLLGEAEIDCDSIIEDAAFSDEDLRRAIKALLSTMQSFLDKGDGKIGSQLFRLALSLGSRGPCAAVDIGLYNNSIRFWGKHRKLDCVFRVLDMMQTAKVEPNNETFEFLANAAVRQVRFVTGAVSMSTLPAPLSAEVAFVGRSNVGKSSLVNMICNRKALAYVSGRPGKTQQFNYFLVNETDRDSQFYLVDLPGVGYAKVPKPIKTAWLKFMVKYLQSRASLGLVFHLVDGRHGTLADDEELMRVMSSSIGHFTYVIVLTKMDKLDRQKAKRYVIDKVRDSLLRNGCPSDTPIVLTSASSRLGRDEMWRHLRNVLGS